VIANDPAVGIVLRRQDQKLDRQDQKLDAGFMAINSLITKLDDRLGKVEERHAETMATLTQLEERHADSMAKMEDRLLAKIGAFHGQFGDIRMDVNDREQRLVTLKSIVTDHGSHLNALTSDLQLQESVLKGYKDTNDTTVATLRTDINDTRAKFPDLRREIQELNAGLTTSIKDVEALVHREVRV
jgi:chromosome segregation ATPase